MSTNLMTIQQVAELLGLSKETLYKMVNQRRIPYVKVGRLLRFNRQKLEEWLSQNTMKPLPPYDR